MRDDITTHRIRQMLRKSPVYGLQVAVCVACGDSESLNVTATTAAQELRAAGWQVADDQGPLCKECAP